MRNEVFHSSPGEMQVSMLEINLGIDLGTAWNIQQVRDTGKGVVVFLCDLVESSEVNAKMK